MNRRGFLIGALSSAAAVTWSPQVRARLSAQPWAAHPILGGLKLEPEAGRVSTPRWTLEGLNAPQAAVADASGHVWISEMGEHALLRVAPDGAVTRLGGYGHALGQLSYPRGLAIGPDGLIYVADGLNHRVQIFAPDGAALRTLGGFNLARDVAFDARGALYVADAGARKIRVFEGDVEVSAFGLSAEAPFSPRGVEVGEDGRVYVADAVRGELLAFSAGGRLLERWRPHATPLGVHRGVDGALCVQVRV